MAAMTVSTEAALADLDQMFPDYDKTALAAVLEVCFGVSALLLHARVMCARARLCVCFCPTAAVSPDLSATSTTSSFRGMTLALALNTTTFCLFNRAMGLARNAEVERSSHLPLPCICSCGVLSDLVSYLQVADVDPHL